MNEGVKEKLLEQLEEHMHKLYRGNTLTEEEMVFVMCAIMDCVADVKQTASILTLLAKRGETVAEITGAAKVLRSIATTIKAPENALDCCGTGGDGAKTVNISTAVALVSAACGVPVAKHGNRAASSHCGAADVLEKLGVNLDAPHKKLEEALEKFNFCFLMAPNHHKAMKYVAPIRKQLAIRTIFNILGPLANPAGTQYQLVGVYDKKWVRPMADVLKNLGAKSAWVVHGQDGLDEITTTTDTDVAILKLDGDIEEKTISPADFGLEVADLDDLSGSTPKRNAEKLRKVLEGEQNAYRDIVIANTSAVLNIHGKASKLDEGAAIAAMAIDDGSALKILDDYAAFTQDK